MRQRVVVHLYVSMDETGYNEQIIRYECQCVSKYSFSFERNGKKEAITKNEILVLNETFKPNFTGIGYNIYTFEEDLDQARDIIKNKIIETASLINDTINNLNNYINNL